MRLTSPVFVLTFVAGGCVVGAASAAKSPSRLKPLPQRPIPRGMALLAVLWIVAALSVIAVGLTRSLRDETRAAVLARQQVQALALGDAAIQIALQAFVARREPLRRVTTADVVFQGVSMQVRLMALNGLVDLNTASQPLLQRLFAVAGEVAPETADRLAQALVQWRQQRDPGGAPRRLKAPEDLLRLPGVDYDLYARLAPLLTVDARGSGRINPMMAPVGVLAVLAGNVDVANQVARARDTGQVGVDTSMFDASLLENTVSRRFRAVASVPMADAGVVHVIRDIALDARSPDGAPWHIFGSGTRIEPARTSRP